MNVMMIKIFDEYTMYTDYISYSVLYLTGQEKAEAFPKLTLS